MFSAADRDPGAIGMKGLVAAECGLGFRGVGEADAGGCRALAGLTSPLPSGRSGLGPVVPRNARDRRHGAQAATQGFLPPGLCSSRPDSGFEPFVLVREPRGEAQSGRGRVLGLLLVPLQVQGRQD